MKNNQRDDVVGDSRSPALRPQEIALRDGVDQADLLLAESSPAIRVQSNAAALASGAKQALECTPPFSCQTRPWLSFFFDGTGNNMDASIGTAKHSKTVNTKVHLSITRSLLLVLVFLGLCGCDVSRFSLADVEEGNPVRTNAYNYTGYDFINITC